MAGSSSIWVRVAASSTNRQYYWRPADDEVTWACPENGDPVWEAAQIQEGGHIGWYYWNTQTQESTWEAPGSPVFDPAITRQEASLSGPWQLTIAFRGSLVPQRFVDPRDIRPPPGLDGRGETDDHNLGTADAPYSHWLQIGAAMAVAEKCSSNSDKYAGQCGKIVEIGDFTVTLELPEQLGGARVAIAARDVIPLPHGTIVQLPTLDGVSEEVGTIRGEESPSASDDGFRMVGSMEPRYCVKLIDDSTRTVFPMDVKPRCRVWNDFSTAPDSWGVLEWRSQQACEFPLFIDRHGEHHRFSIRFPFDFSEWRKLPSEVRKPWPMLVYLHGTGGTGLFGTGKKSLKSVGLNHAASKFVVVSPQCKWTWKDTPAPWVSELVATLRSADYIDHDRVYLSGCSMGGMGVWEVGARTPNLFAALAPIAAHHKPERAKHIAEQLGDMPLFICHSRADGTCPMKQEHPLWMEIRKNNKRMQINLTENVDHCSVFEKVFCDDVRLYDWLQLHRRGMRQ